MRSNAFVLKLLSALLIFNLIGCGGSKLYLLPNSEKIDMPDSERIVSTTYNIKIISYPSTNDLTFTIAVEKKDRIEVGYYNTSTEVVKEWSYLTAVHIFNFTVGWIALMPIWYYASNNGYKLNGKQQINIPPNTLKGNLVYNFKQGSAVNIDWYPTGKVVKGDIKKVYSETEERIIDSKIKIVGNTIANSYDIPKEGAVIIDIVKDFGIKPNSDNIPLELQVYNIENSEIGTMLLDLGKWMKKYIKIELQDEEVLSEIDNQLVIIGKANKGDVFKVIHQGNEFLKIDFLGKEGFVNPNSGEVFWAVKNYLELNK